MKKLLLVAMFLVGCNLNKSVFIPNFDNSNNESRLAALEAAQKAQTQINILVDARLNALENLTNILEMNDANTQQSIANLQNQITVNNINLQNDIAVLEQQQQDNTIQIQQLVSQTTTLNNLLQQEINTRIQEDNNLQVQIDELRNYVNVKLSQLNTQLITYVNNQVTNINNNTQNLEIRVQALESVTQNINSLTQRILNLEQNSVTQTELNQYKQYVNNTYATIAMLNAVTGQVTNINTQVINLQNQVNSLTNLVNSQSTSIVKAPCSNAKEMLLKVGTKYYAVYHTSAVVNNNGVNLLGNNLSYLGELAQNVRYVTTDGTTCYFKINSSNQVVQD